ncbi:hypothetical protein A3A64_00965 [Candidatus Gottesmanbacteria bacterium RIFCSPLOWO2_01_FULL_48_11]|uniref:Uncharacterized protein n=3 Tax=Candidatus Gottesmaniibacteriota TaxID=1752720 RepID=A0A0G1X0Y1_9BACT|nr:MAG: hypothetical protein UY16_C0002G0005 [Candidatus Gottesmanbacteria bacterium GW2011_GWA2_47_9]KKU96218.1 MAG: hypothetical protein UY27_C0002G0003 [Candidatus Gottesmanbacteria bacterium GW2011_GWA1_48_13]OGG28511.1 MAG: hypothetical protein A3A64_00965 [Candidatus Gottesmanbacteria bacterium RIFCSPLOWO2_01_FULL_48_11]HCS79399.1 hypothetical protein [Patescibacteria group bacterium]
MSRIHSKGKEQPPEAVPQMLDTTVSESFDIRGATQPQDVYVALSGRIMQPTYLGEEKEDDPAKRPMGCPCDKETWKISYDDQVETTKKTHPEWTPRKVKVETALQFRPMFRSDKKSIKKEASGERTYDSETTFTMTDDGVFTYTSGGYEGWTIEDLSLRQKRLTPDRYSFRDHQTSLAIQEAFKSGATTVVTSYFREGEGNRDILVMEYDHETKTGKTTVINTEGTGNYHDFSTLRTIAQQEFPAFHETRPSDAIFLLTDRAVSQERIQSAILTVEHAALVPISEPSTQEQSQLVADYKLVDGSTHVVGEDYDERDKPRISERVVTDTIRTVEYVGKSLHQEFQVLSDTVRKDIVVPPFLRRLLGISDHKDSSSEGEKSREMYEEFVHTTPIQEFADPQAQLQEMQEVIKGAKEVIVFAVDPETHGVAIPAAILALDMLAHPETILAEDIQVMREEDETVPLTDKEQEAVIAFLTMDDKEIASLASMQVKQETKLASGLERVDLTVLTWVKELIQRIDEAPVEQAMETIEHEEEATLIKMSELWEVLMDRNIVYSGSNGEFQFSPDQKLERVEKTEREYVENFSLAIAVWVLLKFDAYYRSLRSLKIFIMGETKQGSLLEKLKTHMPEGLIQREPAPWILLAIIWHLAMIREQGMIQGAGYKQQGASKKKTKKKLQNPYIPHDGVIFAYLT